MTNQRFLQYFGYAVAGLLFFLTLFFMLAMLSTGICQINKPFPGFFLYYDGAVMQTLLPHWTGASFGLHYPEIVTSVNGEKFVNSEQVRRIVQNSPVGEEVSYRLYRGSGDGIVEVKIPTMRFTAADFLFDQGLLFLVSFAWLLGGGLIFFFRPNTVMGWGLYLASSGIALGYTAHGFIWELGGETSTWILHILGMWSFAGLGAAIFFLPLTSFSELPFFKNRPWRYIVVYILPAVYIITYAVSYINSNIAVRYVNQQAELFYAVFACLYAAYFTIYTRYTSNVPLIRQRARLTLVGFVVAFAAGAMGLGAMSFGSPLSDAIMGFFTASLPLALTFGALRSNLFEVDIVVRRAVIYSGVLLITACFYAALFQMSQILFSRFAFYENNYYRIAYLIVLIIILSRIKRVIQSGIDRAFFRTKINYEKVIEDVRHKLSVITDVKKIYEAIRDVTVANLFLSDVEILLADGEGNFHSVEKKNVLKKEDDLCKLIMEKNQLISKSDILNDPKLRPVRNRCLAKLAGLESVFLLPINFKDEMLGIMALGERKSGDITFNLQDMEVLHFLAVQSATAFENAKLYQESEAAKKEIEKMNEILEEKVRIRTAELEARAKELEASNEYIIFITHNKSAFLASMSHELRTPLNGIIGFSDMAVEGVYGQINPVAKDVLKDLAFNGHELLQLINDILDLSKIEAGKMEIKMEDFSPRDAVDVALGTWMNECEKKGIKVETEFAPDLPLGWGEEKRVKQVLDTLLRNAVRWSQTKTITIRVACKDNNLVFEVEDYGVGIEAYRMPKLFVEHEYPQILDLKYYKNVGLGLALSKKWAELHGGTMWAESVEGKGSKFSFTIPIKESA